MLPKAHLPVAAQVHRLHSICRQRLAQHPQHILEGGEDEPLFRGRSRPATHDAPQAGLQFRQPRTIQLNLHCEALEISPRCANASGGARVRSCVKV